MRKTLSFFGGAEQVTGACYLLEAGSSRFLIDCGLFQCPRFCDAKNREEFPFNPATLDALFVTHGHIDHIGRIPKLVREGFRGIIYSTKPTRDFAEIMLTDSLGVLEKEAHAAGEQVLYAPDDITRALSLWKGIEYHQPLTVGSALVTLRDAGHILGSAIICINDVAFSGDLGNSPAPLLKDKDMVENARYLVIESAYGNRIHEDVSGRKAKLERIIEDTVRRGGVLMIPAFSLERTQWLLFELNELVENGRIPRVPVFIDSPLAIQATAVYRAYSSYFNEEARSLIQEGDDLFHFPGLQLTRETAESKKINDVPSPKIIIAGAGMMQGGRILHHAKRYLSDAKSAILFIGYQAAGSLGRRIFDGEAEVMIHGEKIPVRATVKAIGAYSAHADSDALLEFVRHTRRTLKKVFVVQGEPVAALHLVQRIRDNLGIDAVAPKYGDQFELET